MFRMTAVIMSPIEFLHRPVSWLRAISRYRVTHSPAPNFGFSFAARRIKDSDLAGVDLSSWRVAMCGAEPIDAGVLGRFAERFAAQGFRKEAFMAAYGLAENTVAVSFAIPGTGLVVDRIDATLLATTGEARAAETGLAVVSVGKPISGHALRVVDALGNEVPDAHQGEIQVRGPSRMLGYRGQRDATSASFDGDWLRTGDLGYVKSGELFVTGRKKDLIIRGGRNYYPQDIEAAATVPGVRHGAVAAFGVRDDKTGTENIVVVAEAKGHAATKSRDLVARIRAAVQDQVGAAVHEVVLVAVGSVPKTTSGKLRRAEARQRYQSGTLAPPKRPGLPLPARVGAPSLLPAHAQRVVDRVLRRFR
jgi:acyl-CoA synthetase (AMP-forming)/AMP-acid ligase II